MNKEIDEEILAHICYTYYVLIFISDEIEN